MGRVADLTGGQAVLLDEQGVIEGTVDVAPEDLPAEEGQSEVDLADGESSALTVVPDGAPADVRIAIVTPRQSSGFGTSPPALIAAAVAFLALGLIFVVLLVRALGSQVREMLSAAHRIGGGDFSQRVPVTGDDELAGLAREFNTMSERLSRQMDELRSQGTELERSLRRTGEAFAAAGDRSSLLQVAADAALPACRAETARAFMTGAPALHAVAGAAPSASMAEALREVEDIVLRDRVPADAGIADAFAFAEPVPGARGTRGRRAVMAVARSGSPFELSERQALRHLAGQVAVALESVELHELVSDEAVATR
jgi:HAMP domain-containing protein